MFYFHKMKKILVRVRTRSFRTNPLSGSFGHACSGHGFRFPILAGQAALAWLLSQEGVIPIPKSANADRVAENAVAGDIELSESDRAELDALFSPPTGPAPLQIY